MCMCMAGSLGCAAEIRTALSMNDIRQENVKNQCGEDPLGFVSQVQSCFRQVCRIQGNNWGVVWSLWGS